MQEMPKAKGFTKHIILYAKGWYEKTDKGIIEDLRRILAKYSNSDINYISDVHLWEFLAEAYSEYAQYFSVSQQRDWLLDLVNKKWTSEWNLPPRKPEEVIIGMLSITNGNVVDTSECLRDIDFS